MVWKIEIDGLDDTRAVVEEEDGLIAIQVLSMAVAEMEYKEIRFIHPNGHLIERFET